MTDNIFFELFNEIDDKYIEEAASIAEDVETYKERLRRHSRIRTALASIAGVAACAALVFGITKLPGTINKLPQQTESNTPSAASGSNAQTFSDLSNSSVPSIDPVSFDIQNILEVTGTPLPESELDDFTYEEILDNYRKILAEDKELTAVLEQINNPDFTERYYRARTLADLMEFVDGAKIVPSDKVQTDHEPATVMSAGRSSTRVFNESGYTFESFMAAFHDVFDDDSAEKLLKRYSRFSEYNGGLYFISCKPNEDNYLIHTDYELKKNTDSEIVFDTVCYRSYERSNIMTDWTFDPKPDFDPGKIDEYTITRITNRFVKENGKWKAEEVYMGEGISSAWDTNFGNSITDDQGNRFVVRGCPLPLSESELSDLDFGRLLDGFINKCNKDKELLALLESIDRFEITYLYYKAGALADRELIYQDLPIDHLRTYIHITDNTPPSISGTITPSYTKGQRFVETGIRSDSFMKALDEVFFAESYALMLARDPYFFIYNGQLFKRYSWPEKWEGPVHKEYRLEENSDDTVRFTTINYFTPPDSDLRGYIPSEKDKYVTVEVNNEFRFIDGKWKAYEVCTPYGYSSRSGKTE